MVAEYDVDIFQDLYAGTTPMKFDPGERRRLGDQLGPVGRGHAEQVRDQYVELRQLPAEYVVLIYHWAQQPAESGGSSSCSWSTSSPRSTR